MNQGKDQVVPLTDRLERASLYRNISSFIDVRSRASQVDPMPAEEFARRLVPLVTRRRPPRLVRLGHGANLIPLLARLPGSLRDYLLRRRHGLNELRRTPRTE